MARDRDRDWKTMAGALGSLPPGGISMTKLVAETGLEEGRALEMLASLLAARCVVLVEGRGEPIVGRSARWRDRLEAAVADDRWSGRSAPRESDFADLPFPPDFDLRVDERAVDPAEEAARREGDRLPVQVWSDAIPWAEHGMPDSACHPTIRAVQNPLTDEDGHCRSCHGHTGGICLMCLPARRPTAEESAIEASRQRRRDEEAA